MALSTFWWLLAGAAVVAEMLTGTVYLLLIGAGLVAAALAAHLGFGLTAQIFTAAVIGSVLVFFWWRVRAPARRAALASQADPDLNLDIGQQVQVDHWNTDGTASVMHRGARWSVVARSPSGTLPAPGPHRIVGLLGSSFVVVPATAR
ncbi:NfeD family protein [Xylophilus sp. Kf1]|nr:NfeD family protein [Xylophilus sp. Kf1]